MTKNVFSIALAGLLLLTLLGCERTVVVDIPPHEHQLVAKGLFSPDSLWKVDVRSSVGFLDRIDPFPIPNATVEVWDGETLIEALQHTEAGVYRGQQSRPEPGKTYRLRITAPDFDPIEAEAALPVANVMPRVAVASVTDDFGFNRLNVSVTLDDPGDEVNYYAMDVLQQVTIYDGPEPVTYTFSNGFFSADVILSGLAIETEETFYHTAYFEDDIFDGTTQTFSLDVQKPFIESQSSRAPDFKITLRFYVTTEDFFRYHKTLELQEDLDGNPFSEPIRIHSNVSNGFGVFAGYRAVSVVLLDDATSKAIAQEAPDAR